MGQKQITDDMIAAYESTSPIFDELYIEIRALAMKKPDATLSKAKVALVNRLLADIQGFLQDENHGKYLDLLEEDQLPQYSDILLIMSQYNGALKSFKEKYYYYSADLPGTGWHYFART